MEVESCAIFSGHAVGVDVICHEQHTRTCNERAGVGEQ